MNGILPGTPDARDRRRARQDVARALRRLIPPHHDHLRSHPELCDADLEVRCDCSDECHECHRIVPAGELDRFGRCDAAECREVSGFDEAIEAMAKAATEAA